MKYTLKVKEIRPEMEVEVPNNAMLPNLSDPNDLGICELTYLAPVKQ